MSRQFGFVGVAFVLVATLRCASTALDKSDDDAAGPRGGSGTGGAAGGSSGDAGSSVETECLLEPRSSSVGYGCGCNEDCSFGEACIPEVGPPESSGFPGGKCSNTCGPSTKCPEDFECIALTPGSPWAGCEMTCGTTEDCRRGYVCGPFVAIATPAQTEGLPDGFFCLPWCQDDEDCARAGRCNPFTGQCSAAAPEASDVGAACSTLADCPTSQVCLPTYGPSGYCSTYCSLSRQGCPAGSVCKKLFSEDRGDFGLCMQSCSTTSDCRSGYVCGSGGEGGPKVCGARG